MGNSSTYKYFGMNNRKEEIAYYRNLHDQALEKITSSEEEWKKFLEMAERLPKFSFDDCIYIYAQNPDASICGDFRSWKQIQRGVKKNNHGHRAGAGGQRLQGKDQIFQFCKCAGVDEYL